MSSQHFAYIWEYTIDASLRDDFLNAYAPEGEWAKLMSRHPGYISTCLLHDTENGNRYVTVDYWVSKSDRDSFRSMFSDEYNQLDQKCEHFTAVELFIGDFFVVDGSAA